MKEFKNTKFLLLDPSEGMLKQVQKKLPSNKNYKIELLRPSTTQELILEKKSDVITAIQCHHYLSRKDREKAVNVCYKILKDDGVFITFENIRPLTEKGIEVGKKY